MHQPAAVFLWRRDFSRTAQMMIIDMIYMGLIASDYDRFSAALDRSGRAVCDKAYLPV